MIKKTALFIAICLTFPASLFAADAVKIDVFLNGENKQTVSLSGYGSFMTFKPRGLPDTTLELRLIAPEPVIVDVKETVTGEQAAVNVGRVKLVAPGSTYDVSELKEVRFRQPYLLVRQN